MILSINAGSSSIKFALYEPGIAFKKVCSGHINRIGLPDLKFIFNGKDVSKNKTLDGKNSNFDSVIEQLITLLEKKVDFLKITAIGHRVVQGMQYNEHGFITAKMFEKLKQIRSFDPEHLPNEIKLIEAFKHLHPEIKQYACFDTAFHKTMPRVATLIPIPRRFEKLGIKRYGFHGISYNYLIEELENICGKNASKGKVIIAHLGNGASITALLHGKSIETSMGFTPCSGLPMGSRSGDLDPGVAWYMMKTEKLSAKKFNHMMNHESGLLGISETSADMNDLLRQEEHDIRSKEAVDLFCYQVKKWIGAYAAILGGIDMLVFTGGIGENSPIIRARICKGLTFLGIELNEKRNNENNAITSLESGSVAVRVIHTNEELMIAKIVDKLQIQRISNQS